MVKRKFLITLCCAVFMFLLAGCQLAHESGGMEPYEDRMIGVFVTTEYLEREDGTNYNEWYVVTMERGRRFYEKD